MSPTDRAYFALIEALPISMREQAKELPRRLGLTQALVGGWEDYVQLALLRELPGHAAEGLAALTAERLARFQEAHLRAGFYGLLADRLADGQASPAEAALLPYCESGWRDALSAATEDRALAERLIDGALAALAEGVASERALATTRRMTPQQYWHCSCAKVAWLAVAPLALLRSLNVDGRARLFGAAFDLLLFSSQCLDDAQDVAEDERLFGIGVPAALGFPVAALVRAAPRLVQRAHQLASAGGFNRFAAGLAERAQLLASAQPASGHLQSEMAALIICETGERTCLSRLSRWDTQSVAETRRQPPRSSSGSMSSS